MILLPHSAQMWMDRLCSSCSAEHTRKLQKQYVCSQHFSEIVFTSAGKTHPNNVTIPYLCTVIAHPCSALLSKGLALSFSFSEEDLHVLVPTETYSRMSITLVTEEPVPIQSHSSVPLVISLDLSLPAEASTFLNEDLLTP